MAASSSYCYSETVTVWGVTPNAAGAGLQWSMGNYLPNASSQYTTVTINGLIYRYTMNKDAAESVIATVRNEDPINGGYVFSETDDWSGVPGNSITKYFTFGGIDSTRWGTGEIDVQGNGIVTNPKVVYSYKMVVEDAPGYNCAVAPMSDPTCPGFLTALYAYLKVQDDLNPDDPYYDEWVQLQLQEELEKEQLAEIADADAEEEEDLEVQMFGENRMGDLIDTKAQSEMLAALSMVPTIQPYYTINIPGGQYNDTVVLQDSNLPDNRRVLRNLASDATHNKMVQSQYVKEQ